MGGQAAYGKALVKALYSLEAQGLKCTLQRWASRTVITIHYVLMEPLAFTAVKPHPLTTPPFAHPGTLLSEPLSSWNLSKPTCKPCLKRKQKVNQRGKLKGIRRRERGGKAPRCG